LRLVAIVKKELNLDRSLNEILQIISITLFERSPIYQALTTSYQQDLDVDSCKQLLLCNF